MQSDYSYSCVAKAMAYWLIIASIIAIVAACPHSQQKLVWGQLIWEENGTDCSVFNNNKTCCLPYANCTAVSNMSRSCSCSPQCYSDRKVECCKDIYCPTTDKPRTCQDFACCYKNITNSNCYGAPLVNENGTEIDPDNGIDCTNKEESCPKTCSAANKETGYCKWQYRKLNVSCYIEQGKCYCDQFCFDYEDCCEDVYELLNRHGRFRHLMVIMSLLTDDSEGNGPSQHRLALSARLLNNRDDYNNIRIP